MGCVLPAGTGQAPARQAAKGAGLPDAVGATTVNKVCGSGMKAIMLGHDAIAAGSADIVVGGRHGIHVQCAASAGQGARRHPKMGDVRLADHMMLDGLEDAYERGRPMGDFGESVCRPISSRRADQDEYAVESLTRAQAAIAAGDFRAEIAPVAVPSRKGDVTISDDEHPGQVSVEKLAGLKPAFRADGTITAASSSSMPMAPPH